jgi:hypothetical protein
MTEAVASTPLKALVVTPIAQSYRLAGPPDSGGVVDEAVNAAKTGPPDQAATRPVTSPAVATTVHAVRRARIHHLTGSW